jgi:hypothetical protein
VKGGGAVRGDEVVRGGGGMRVVVQWLNEGWWCSGAVRGGGAVRQ